MRVRTMIVLVLTLVLGAAMSEAEWRMRVHRSGEFDEFAVSEIDSLTFHDVYLGVPEMVTVPAGVFTMGDGLSSCGLIQREVTLTRDFGLCQHEVTNLEYMEVLQWAYDAGHVTATTTSVRDNLDGSTEELLDLSSDNCEIQFDGAGTFYLRESPSAGAQNAYPDGYDPADHPVKEVTWYGAARYCDWLSLLNGLPRAYEHTGDWSCNDGDPYGAHGFRLPTDAEWEYAAQFNDDRIYPWGDEDPDCSRANYYPAGPCVGWTSPVSDYPDAPETLGLSDLAGNVAEWSNDWLECYPEPAPATDPPGPATGDYRLMHGGSWFSNATRVRNAYRSGHYPYMADSIFGFRAARTMAP